MPSTYAQVWCLSQLFIIIIITIIIIYPFEHKI